MSKRVLRIINVTVLVNAASIQYHAILGEEKYRLSLNPNSMERVFKYVLSNFNGSNTFGTMKISSRQG